MARQIQIICNACDALKREANHWWSIYIASDGALILMEVPTQDPGESVLDLCSEQCVHETVSKYLRGELKP